MNTPIRITLTALLSAASLLTMPTAAALAVAPAAQLSVTLTSSEKTVDSGDTITYTGHVENLGTEDAAVKIVLSAPAYVELADTSGADVDKSTATWTPTIAAGEEASFSIDATIGTIPDTERRVTTLASVYQGDDPAPLVRTADARFITGVNDTPDGSSQPSTQDASPGAFQLLWILGAVIVAATVVTAVILVRRRRREPAPVAPVEPEASDVKEPDEWR